MRHGYGICYYDKGDVYSGNWMKGVKNGFGKYISRHKYTYIGFWKQDKPCGSGKFWNYDGEYY